MNFPFTKDDLQQICKHGLTTTQVEKQLDTFNEGLPIIQITAPATVGEGILKLNSSDRQGFIKTYEHSKKNIVKFVPASGAATRMFKLLHEFDTKYTPEKDTLTSFLQQAHFKPLQFLFDNFENLPFYHCVVKKFTQTYPKYSFSSLEDKNYNLIHFLINEMEYPSHPKGLIPFHRYQEKTTTAFEEHFKEALEYGQTNTPPHLHFTIAEEHLELFKTTFNSFHPQIKQADFPFEVSYSFQDKSTDTIAVNNDNQPFRDENGALFFRPGGHGALIKNLDKIDSDIVFIKNIDNVVTDKNLSLMAAYKKVLGGVLITVQESVFSILKELDQKGFSNGLQKKAATIALSSFGSHKEFHSAESIRSYFDRPIRVCGMVQNKGEPGGGPFWVKEKARGLSLQIVENAQIDKTDQSQVDIMQKATHFNPVDLACGVRDYKGHKFDLHQFINTEEGFIAHKSKNGKPLKALELPGLWNGAMAYWNTIFVEVPLETFNPAKTIIDLLNPGHQDK